MILAIIMQAKRTAELRLQQAIKDQNEVLSLAQEASIELDLDEPFEVENNVVAYDDFMRYAKLRANLHHLDSMLISGGAFVAAFDGTAAARSVVLRQQSQKTRADLEKAVKKLERKLGLQQPPDFQSPQMQVQLSESVYMICAGKLCLFLSKNGSVIDCPGQRKEKRTINSPGAHAHKVF